ncbi:hypothetical protein DM02DRAFT_519445 [Periconia macrospinosa]|uniref:Uncharacterized protein n=1 Tax=Periconia macrospinosa TaxID=97972 RepID=A0A2V1E1J3_9PLEO|nr:hypothetical protein DM02DRAFT_519445 [Periconia macrospinosa]
MIFNVLPATVQSRIPAISSIRKIVNSARGDASPPKSGSCSVETQSPETPPPGYTSRPTSSRSRSSRHSIDSFDAELVFQECISTRPQSSVSTPPDIFQMAESSTGINWKYANQGINLVSQSYTESHALVHVDEQTSATLTRQLYIHGMTYLLRGLPSDLTPEETVCLQAAIPSNLAVVHTEACTQPMIAFPQDPATPREPPEDPSTLHRVIAILVFQTFVMIEFLLPYIKLLAGHAYRFEKEHKITQKMVNNGLMTADLLRQRSLELSHTVCQMNDGKVGQALNDMVIWMVRGLTGGFQQGVTDGITMMSNERSKNQKRLEQAE